MAEYQRLLTLREASALLSVNPEVMRRWLRGGQMKGVKVGSDWRIRQEDIDELMHSSPKTASVDKSVANAADDSPKMCVKFPKWVEYSGLPAHLNREIGPEAWSVFKKIVELDFEKGEREDRKIFLDEADLPERIGYSVETVERIIAALREHKFIRTGHERKFGAWVSIVTPLHTPNMVLDISFEHGGIKGAPSKAFEKNCVRRYLEFSK
ncbi:MAG: helix-turn-helix domain-containing protein [Candidatus Riflebacteria bacterium]|nr:helix-turn-helix domain-containing protein [Candidatus Riflebacteria bacterium]